MEASTAGSGDEPGRQPAWSPAKLVAFRFAITIAALLLPSIAIFIPVHLWFDFLKQPVALALGRCDIFEHRVAIVVGAFLIRIVTGSKESIREMTVRFNSDWFASAIPDLVGLFALALVIAAIWSALDRRRNDYRLLNRWMRVYLRYGLATATLSYAFIKVIPTQFGHLTPGRMLQAFGQLSHFQLLWDFMATSPGYTIFTGLIELFGAVLLFFRRTTLLGAILLAGALTNVIAMDFAYKVGALRYALALLLLDILILSPYLRPLFDILLIRGTGTLPPEPMGERQRWWHSPIAKASLIGVLTLPLVAINIQRVQSFLRASQPVYGLFDVVTFTRNGLVLSPPASDGVIWKRVASDPTDNGGGIVVEFANGDLRRFELTDDPVHHRWTIRNRESGLAGDLNYDAGPGGALSLDGRIGSDTVHLLLHRVDMNKAFPLLTR